MVVVQKNHENLSLKEYNYVTLFGERRAVILKRGGETPRNVWIP